jgi:hypothetical protein
MGAFIIFPISLAKGGVEFAVTQQAKPSVKRLAQRRPANPDPMVDPKNWTTG